MHSFVLELLPSLKILSTVFLFFIAFGRMKIKLEKVGISLRVGHPKTNDSDIFAYQFPAWKPFIDVRL